MPHFSQNCWSNLKNAPFLAKSLIKFEKCPIFWQNRWSNLKNAPFLAKSLIKFEKCPIFGKIALADWMTSSLCVWSGWWRHHYVHGLYIGEARRCRNLKNAPFLAKSLIKFEKCPILAKLLSKLENAPFLAKSLIKCEKCPIFGKIAVADWMTSSLCVMTSSLCVWPLYRWG